MAEANNRLAEIFSELFFEMYKSVDDRATPKSIRLAYGLETQFIVAIDELQKSEATTGTGLQ